MPTYTTQGTTLARGDAASPEVFTTIPQITSITPIGQDVGLIDVSNLASTAREYKTALKDGQEISLTIQYDPDHAQHSGLKSDLDNGTTRNFRLTLTDSPAQVWDFAALVTNWSLAIDIDSVYILSVTLKPTADITIT